MNSSEKINYLLIPGKAEMWSDHDDICWLVFLPGSEISAEDMQQIVTTATRNHHRGELFKVLVDISRAHSITHEARTFAAGTQNMYFYSRMAIIAGTPAARIVGNFFIRFHKPPRPAKIFSTTEEAKGWLLQNKKATVKILGNGEQVAA